MSIEAKFCLIIVVAAAIVGCGRDTSNTGSSLRPVDETATAASVLLDDALAEATSVREGTQTAVTLSEQTTPVGGDVTPTNSQADQVATLVAATLTAIPTATLTPTPTPDWGATQTAVAAQVATVVAATLSAAPTATWAPTPTSTPALTPELDATQTAAAAQVATMVAATLAAVPTATPGWTATAEALAAQVATSVAATAAAQRAATPQPRAGNFRACLEPCAANGANARWSMPEAVTKVYVAHDYNGIPAGAHYQRIWRVVGRGEWVRYDCTWPGPSNGTVEVTLTEPKGLYSGEWEMVIVIDGVLILRESFVIEGGWRAWDPAGVIPTCFGKVSTR